MPLKASQMIQSGSTCNSPKLDPIQIPKEVVWLYKLQNTSKYNIIQQREWTNYAIYNKLDESNKQNIE